VDDASDFINVFKLCGLDQMTNATREGEVTTVVDRGLGRKVVLVTGNVPAANFVRVPKIGKPPLGLTGRYVYAQVKLDPERFYAVHVDCLCSDPTAKSGANTGFTVGRTTVRLSCSNLYKRKSSRPDPAGTSATTLSGSAVNFVHEPPARKWHVLVFDTHGLVRRVPSTDQGAKSQGKKSKEPPRFDCVKSIQLGGGCAVRNVFISDTLYDADTLPKEMHLSSKPGVDVVWTRVGGVDPNGQGGSKPRGVVDPLAPPPTGPTNKAIPPDGAASAPIVAVPHTTNVPTTPYATHDDATIEARRATPRDQTPRRRPAFDDEAGQTTKTKDKKTSTARPSSPPLVGHEDASLDEPPSPPRASSRDAAGRATGAIRRGKPRAARPGLPSRGDPSEDVGFFGDGGAGGLRSSSRHVSGAVNDVDAVTGMPYAMDGGARGLTPPNVGYPDDAPPALALTRAVGLTGEFPGAVAWCPDGTTVAYPVNSLVALHDVRTGAQSHLFGHTDRVHLSCFSRDGRVLVTGQRGRHPLVKVWDVESNAQVATLYAHASGLKSLDVSPCGRAVVAAGTDTSGRQMIAVWDIGRAMRGGFAPMTLRHRTDYHVNCVKFSPFEEDHVVTCGKNSIRTYRLRKGQLRGCSVDLGDLKLSKLAPKGLTQKGRKRDDFELNDFTSLAFEIGYGVADLDQKKVFCATVTGAVVQVNYGKRQLERVFQLHDDKINDLRVCEGFAVTASDDGFLRVWPVDFSDFFLEAEHESAVTSCSVSADGLQVAAATRTGSLGVLDIPSHAYRTLLRSHAGAVTGVAFDPDPERDEMATCSEDGTARVWDCATGEQLYEFAGDAGEVACAVAYRPDGNVGLGLPGKNKAGRALAVGFGGGVSRVYDVATTTTLAEHRQHKGDVVSVQFTPDGSRMITAGAEGNLCVYDAKNGYLPVKYLATALPTDRVRAAISPDGKLLATIGPNGETVLTFDVETLKLRSPALVPPRLLRTGGRSKVLAFAFTPDGKSIVVANDDDAVSTHSCADDRGDGAPRRVGRGLVTGPLDAVAVDPTGVFAVLGGRDKSLVAAPLSGFAEAFAPADRQAKVPSQAYGAHWGAVRGVAFDSLGARCASVGDGDAVYVWSVDARAGKALAASKARDLLGVSFDIRPGADGGAVEDAGDSAGDSADSPGGVDGDAEPGEPGDAFEPKPKLAATPGTPERGILKKHPTPAKSALKTDGKYGGGKYGEDAKYVEEPAEADDEADAEAEGVDAEVPEPPVDRPDPPVEPGVDVDPGHTSGKVTRAKRPPGKKPVLHPSIRPARVIGLSTGAAAAGNESTESAAAVAAATACAPALYVPELGSTLFAAGCDVVIERAGGERQQALLRRHPFPITALAHHPETRRIASASASDVGQFTNSEGPGECVVCVWDASTGACLVELVHERAGGCVVSLEFSPEGAMLLSAGADPDGALRVWDVSTGARVLAASANAPVAAAGWCTHSPRAEFFTAGADGAWLHSLRDETGTTGSHTVAKIAFDDLNDDLNDGGGGETTEGARRALKNPRGKNPPVCTAACVAADGSLFVGDSRGRVWRSPMRVGTSDEGAFSTPVPLAKCCDALGANEAVTAVKALPGSRLFVGGARRARVWINARAGRGWEEVGELELDGAVVAANFDASLGSGSVETNKPAVREPWGVVTTSAGSAWLVEIATGTARALVQAHPLDVAHASVKSLGHRTAMATVSVDGTARVWDCAAGAKVLEVHADVSNMTVRATRAAVSPDGTRLCLGCRDGGVAVVTVGAGVGGVAPGVQGPVRHARAHPSGAAVVHASFLRTGVSEGPTFSRLLTVAADGSISLTDVDTCECRQLFPGVSNSLDGSMHQRDPVVQAAVSEPAVGAGDVLVALARASSLQTISVTNLGSKCELRSTFKPTPRGTYVTAPGMCAWSETRRGACYYASRATGGRVVRFDAMKGEVIDVVDCDAGAGAGGPWCVAVTERAGRDALAVGTARGVEFLSVSDGDGDVSNRGSGGGVVIKKERSGTCAMANGARHVAWTEDGDGAWVCSGTCAYLVADPFGQLERK